MKRVLIIIVILGLIWHLLSIYPSPTSGPLAPKPPVQTGLKPGDAAAWTLDRYTIRPLARYQLKARILHRDDYYFDHASVVSPFDFALGWGNMSDPKIYAQLHISQGGRWYTYYWWGEPPLGQDEIVASSANTHIIPASPEIKSKMTWWRAGDLVKLSGYLVAIDGLGPEPWTSSLSRTDTGDGSCEIMWVTDAEKVGR
jgi:hypothetical protein